MPVILTETHPSGVRVVTLNRPERKNAFDGALWDGAAAALDDARGDRSVAAVVITGAGGDFSAGMDLTAFEQRPRDDGFATDYEAFMHSLIAFDKPLLAAVDGVAVGIGATLPLHCDVVFVGDRLRMRFPFVSLGLVPEGAASVLLERVVGARRAGELLLTAEWLDTPAAVDAGLATAAHPSDDLLAATVARAEAMACWPVSALQATKGTVLAARRDAVLHAVEREMAAMNALVMGPENMEAVTAFLERRDPDFSRFRT